jgi:hypothetical protein
MRYMIAGAAILSASLLPAQTPTPPPDIDRYVAQVMAAFEIPGIAVAIVENGKVVLAKGYGVRELGKPDRVDERTRFAIASNPARHSRPPRSRFWLRTENSSGTRPSSATCLALRSMTHSSPESSPCAMESW